MLNKEVIIYRIYDDDTKLSYKRRNINTDYYSTTLAINIWYFLDSRESYEETIYNMPAVCAVER